MNIDSLRSEIDKVDDQIVNLFSQRMQIASQIADYKKEHVLPIYVPSREKEKLKDIARKSAPGMENYTRVLYSTLFELSRSYQQKQNAVESEQFREITRAIEATPQLFPQAPAVACQGVEGAYSQMAAEKMFQQPFIMYFRNLEGVFQAVNQGLCQYGVLPLENSTGGSVKKVYDLLIEHHFSIIRTFRLRVEHNLLAKPGTKLQDIKIIYSHEHAINQCSEFLKKFPDVRMIPVENTAVAAEMVSKSPGSDTAALSSHLCAELYNLQCLAASVQDKACNRTRFICISKNLEIYPGSDRTSIMMVLPHRPGALYKVLTRLYVLGINVTKLESRPIPDRDFEYRFYFDLETSIYSEEFVQLICDLDELCTEFRYLGSYCEVV